MCQRKHTETPQIKKHVIQRKLCHIARFYVVFFMLHHRFIQCLLKLTRHLPYSLITTARVMPLKT